MTLLEVVVINKSLNPATNVAKVFTVDTSRRYSVAPDTAPQLAVNDVEATKVSAVATGATGAATKVVVVIIFELVEVPDTFLALTR